MRLFPVDERIAGSVGNARDRDESIDDDRAVLLRLDLRATLGADVVVRPERPLVSRVRAEVLKVDVRGGDEIVIGLEPVGLGDVLGTVVDVAGADEGRELNAGDREIFDIGVC